MPNWRQRSARIMRQFWRVWPPGRPTGRAGRPGHRRRSGRAPDAPGDGPRGGSAVPADWRRHRRHRGLGPDRTPAGPPSLPAPVLPASANLNSRIQLRSDAEGAARPSPWTASNSGPQRGRRQTAGTVRVLSSAGLRLALSGRSVTAASRTGSAQRRPCRAARWQPEGLPSVTWVHGGGAHVAAVRRGNSAVGPGDFGRARTAVLRVQDENGGSSATASARIGVRGRRGSRTPSLSPGPWRIQTVTTSQRWSRSPGTGAWSTTTPCSNG